MAYERLEGTLGPLRADYHAALVASVIANAHLDPKKKAYKVGDFLPRWDVEPQSSDQQRAIFEALTKDVT